MSVDRAVALAGMGAVCLAKVCTKCGEAKELGEFYGCGAGRPGRVAKCKTCSVAAARDQYIRKKAARPEEGFGGVTLKRCSKCDVERPLGAFSPSATGRFGRLGSCKACQAGAKRARYLADPEKYRAISAKWAQRNPEYVQAYNARWLDANLDRRLAYNKRWRDANPDKARASVKAWAERNPGRRREADQAWKLANPDKVIAYRNRANLKRGAGPQLVAWNVWPDIDPLHRAARQLTKATGLKHVVDHIFPLVSDRVCGLNCAANLRVIPASTNSRKSNKLPGFLADELWDPLGDDVFHETDDVVEEALP